jgi:hypothetical protein
MYGYSEKLSKALDDFEAAIDAARNDGNSYVDKRMRVFARLRMLEALEEEIKMQKGDEL